MDLKIYEDVEHLILAVADSICDASKEAILSRGQFNFVLSGGSSPKKLYELLASKYSEKIEWSKTFFFFGDERFVPENDPQRNSLMAKEVLFKPLKISSSQICTVDTTGTAEDSAKKYNADIAKHFEGKSIVFDYILLGLGDNAHTASLFPNTSVLNDKEPIIKSVFVDEVNMFRITMNAPLINNARQISFLVFGKEKATAVFQVLEEKSGSSAEFPARLINSHSENVKWFLDCAAASELQDLN